MLTKIIHPDIHQLAGIKRASAKMRGCRRMRRLAMKGEINSRIGKRMAMLDSVKGGRVPRNRRINIIKQSIARHIRFGCTAFFSRTTIIAHPCRNAVFGKPVLDRCCRQKRRCPQQIMAASMPIAARFNRAMFGDTRCLTKLGKRVKFTKNGNHRPFGSSLAHNRCRHAANAFGNGKSLSFERRHMFGNRCKFIVKRFGCFKNPIR